MRNGEVRAIGINFDPGSTIKTASLGIAIEKGIYK